MARNGVNVQICTFAYRESMPINVQWLISTADISMVTGERIIAVRTFPVVYSPYIPRHCMSIKFSVNFPAASEDVGIMIHKEMQSCCQLY